MDFLYYLCIYPLEGFMRAVLEFGHDFTGSFGQALLLLSLAVNIVLIPFYHLAESWQEAERGAQKAMAPKLAEIQAVYRGRERYMLTRALHRLHGYSPAMALRTSAGLLIQIPFFFAAFHLLNNSPELAGAPFAFIDDLGKPDGLLALGGAKVNLLPFVMTAVNLLSAAVYTSRLSAKEKAQLYVLAALFLILLYTSSAALLIYWTCNNIFSVFKNIVYQRYLYADSAHGRQRAAASETKTAMARLSGIDEMGGQGHHAPGGDSKGAQSLWPPEASGAADKSGGRFAAIGRALPRQLDLAPGLVCLAAFPASVFLAKSQGSAATVSIAVTGAAALSGALALALRCLRLRGGDRIDKCLPLFYLLIAFCVSFIIWQLTSAKKLASPPSWAYMRLYAAALGALTGWLLARRPLHLFFRRAALFCEKNLPSRHAPSLFSAGVLLAATIVFWYSPAQLYASDPDFFYEPLSRLMAGVILRGLVFFAAALCFFRLAGEPLKAFAALFGAWLGLGVFCYTFIATGDYGTMDGFILQEPSLLRSRLAMLVDPLVASGAAFLLWLALYKGRGRTLAGLAQGACLAVICLGGWQLASAPPRQAGLLGVEEASSRLPAYNERLFGFSKSEKNVVVLMMDMFTGGHLGLILEEDKDLARRFDGFTWYPDTSSAGATTLLSLPSIMGGELYSPEAINARKPASIQEELQKGFAVLPGALIPMGYDVAFAGLDELIPSIFADFCPRMPEMLLVGRGIDSAYTAYWRDKMNLPSPLPETQTPFLAGVGFFYAAPWLLRPHIYSNGAWMNTQTVVFNRSEGPMAMLDLLPEIMNLGSDRPTLKVVASQAVHYPWRIDGASCLPTAGGGETRRADNVISEHLDAERCAIRAVARWLESLKEAGIYDNTQIIIVSDHDGNDNLLGKEYDDMRKMRIPWKPSALLLVKGFGERGPLRVDAGFMSAADVPSLVCRDNGPCPDIPGLNAEILEGAGSGEGKEITKRVRIHNAGLASIRRHKKDRFIVDSYRIEGSMFRRENWSEVKEDAQ